MIDNDISNFYYFIVSYGLKVEYFIILLNKI